MLLFSSNICKLCLTFLQHFFSNHILAMCKSWLFGFVFVLAYFIQTLGAGVNKLKIEIDKTISNSVVESQNCTTKSSSRFGLTSHSSQWCRSYQEKNPSGYLKFSLEFKLGSQQ